MIVLGLSAMLTATFTLAAVSLLINIDFERGSPVSRVL
jgi:hypothetical protein